MTTRESAGAAEPSNISGASVSEAPMTSEEMDVDYDPEARRREAALVGVLDKKVHLMWWLLGANLLFWVAAKMYGIFHLMPATGASSAGFNAEQLVFYTGMKVNVHIAGGQWWRLLSSQFVHLDILHILMNGYGLYLLGPMLERFYGPRRLFVLYVMSGSIASLASYYFNDIPSGGASGAIYGLVGGLLVFGAKYRKVLPQRVTRALTTGFLPWVIFGLGIGFIGSIPMDNAAHLGGLFSGAAIAFVMASRLKTTEKRGIDGIGNVFVWVFAVLGVLALAWTAVEWSQEIVKCTDTMQSFGQCYPELLVRR